MGFFPVPQRRIAIWVCVGLDRSVTSFAIVVGKNISGVAQNVNGELKVLGKAGQIWSKCISHTRNKHQKKIENI